MRLPHLTLIGCALMLALTGCSDAPDDAPPKPLPKQTGAALTSAPKPATAALPAPITTAAQQAQTALCQQTAVFTDAIATFLAQPQAATLQSASREWSKLHTDWQVHTIYFGDAKQRAEGDWLIDSVDAAPLLPGYLDEVIGYPSSGLVSADLAITREMLRYEHQSTDPYYVALGFHAIEFILKGETGTRDTDAFAPLALAAPAMTSSDSFPVPERRSRLLRAMARQLNEELLARCAETASPLTLATLPDHLKQITDALLMRLEDSDMADTHAQFSDFPREEWLSVVEHMQTLAAQPALADWKQGPAALTAMKTVAQALKPEGKASNAETAQTFATEKLKPALQALKASFNACAKATAGCAP